MTVARTTQDIVETVSQVNPTSRVSQLVIEAISANLNTARISQLVVEMISTNVADDAAASTTRKPVVIICT